MMAGMKLPGLLGLLAGVLLLGGCKEEPKKAAGGDAPRSPNTEAIRGLVERAAEQTLPAPSLAALDFEVPCPFADLDVRRDALIAKAKELGGSAVEGLRDGDRQRRLAVQLPGSSVAAFRLAAGAPVVGSTAEKESFDVTLKAP